MKQRSLKDIRSGICILAILAQSSLACFGWGPGGHMMVAKIAHDRLNPKAKAEADRLAAIKINPVNVTAESLDFIEASHWPDDVRTLFGFTNTAEFHFVDFPFSQDGTELPEDLPKEQNVLRALTSYVNTLKTSADDNEKAQALRFIIHLVGDVHQPLHCSSRVTSKFTEGDRGGNEVHITETDAEGQKHAKSLHSFWDGGLDTFPATGHLAPPAVADIEKAADALVKKFPDTDPNWNKGTAFDFNTWAQESFTLAKQQVYTDLVPRKAIPQSYMDRCTPIAERRVVWAGYRLAKLLNTIWPAEAANSTTNDSAFAQAQTPSGQVSR
jgi:hypothetical protein